MDGDKPYVTDNSNYIIDLYFQVTYLLIVFSFFFLECVVYPYSSGTSKSEFMYVGLDCSGGIDDYGDGSGINCI